LIYAVIFSVFEKVKKEQFVVYYTHSKTKRTLIQLFNNYPYPVAIVNSQGQFQFYNEQFEKLVKERLYIKPFPPSIFKLTALHQDSNTKL